MKKAAKSGQFRTFVGGLLTTKDDAIPSIDGNLMQKAIDECGSGTTQAEFIKWINNSCKLTTVLANAFIVGHVFRHRAEKGDHRLWLSDNTQNWLIKPNLKKVIPIHTDVGRLTENRLPNSMNDTAIQDLADLFHLFNDQSIRIIFYKLIFPRNLKKIF